MARRTANWLEITCKPTGSLAETITTGISTDDGIMGLFTQDLVAVLVGQHQIEHNNIWVARTHLFQRFMPAGSADHLEAWAG